MREVCRRLGPTDLERHAAIFPDTGAEINRAVDIVTPLTSSIETRMVGPGDLELICRHRKEMFADAGSDDESLTVMTANFRAWLEPRLADGSYFGFILELEDRPVAGVGLMLIDWPPHPAHPSQAQRGYVLNVFVEPQCRRRGLARELMRRAEAEFARRGVEFGILHATEQGQPLYSGLGWVNTSEMAKTFGR